MSDPDKDWVGMGICFFCGKDNTIVINLRLGKTLPRQGLYDMTPCEDCRLLMERGVLFLVAEDGEMAKLPAQQTEFEWKKADQLAHLHHGSLHYREIEQRHFIPQVRRTGQIYVLADEWVKQTIKQQALQDQILRCRWTFIEEHVAKQIGLDQAEATYQTMEEMRGQTQTQGTQAQGTQGPEEAPIDA